MSDSLVQAYPDNSNVRRVARAMDVHNMAELRVQAEYDFAPMNTFTAINGGQAYGFGAQVYSAPIDYNWRIFAGEFFSHQAEPFNSGSVSASRTDVGVEYRNGNTTASLSPTYNHYHDSERVGGAVDVTENLNDNWTVAAGGELFSAATPLRALNGGITSNFLGAHATWAKDESQSLRFGGDLQPFSDDNFRSALDAEYTQRLWTAPEWRINGLVNGAESQNTKDENRPYYNPSRDLIGLVGAQAINTLYQRYSTLWQHSLTITPGAYWQQHYGTDAALRIRYEQRLFLNDTFEIGAGVNYSHQSYDGNSEDDVGVTLDALERF